MAKALIADVSPEALENFSKRMPTRIQDALDFPIVAEMVRASGEENVQAYVEFELIKLANLVSVGGNLNNSQVVFIASELLKTYPNETLADFKLCFQRGAIGQYGEIFRLDGIVIRGWMEKYLDEKYQVVEKKLMEEKDDLYKQIPRTLTEEVQEQQIKDRLQEWKAAIEQTANDKTIRPMTDQEIEREGKAKIPRASLYKPTYTLAEIEARRKLQRAASEFYKGRRSFDLKSFEVEGIEFMAESEQDAIEIYNIATK